MLKVARVTIERLLLDKTVLISLLIIPVIIILIFSKMSVSTPEETQLRIGILENQSDLLTESQKSNFTILYAKDSETLKTNVIKGKIAAGFLLEGEEVTKVFSLSEVYGEYALTQFKATESSEKKVQTVDRLTAQKKTVITILNFLINYMMFSMIFIATDIVGLKRNRIMHRIGSMPLTEIQIFSGHLIAFLVLLTLQIIEVNLVIYLVVGIPLSANLLGGVLILMLLMVIVLSFGLLITRFTSNLSLVPLFCNGLLIPMMMASGTFMPVDQHPILSKVKLLTPQYWVVDAVKQMNQMGQGHTGILIHAAVLLIMGLLIFALAVVGQNSKGKLTAL